MFKLKGRNQAPQTETGPVSGTDQGHNPLDRLNYHLELGSIRVNDGQILRLHLEDRLACPEIGQRLNWPPALVDSRLSLTLPLVELAPDSHAYKRRYQIYIKSQLSDIHEPVSALIASRAEQLLTSGIFSSTETTVIKRWLGLAVGDRCHYRAIAQDLNLEEKLVFEYCRVIKPLLIEPADSRIYQRHFKDFANNQFRLRLTAAG